MNARDVWREVAGLLRWRREREIDEQAWRAARERNAAWHAGIWRGPRDTVVVVRWDPIVRIHFVAQDGGAEAAWVNPGTLRRWLIALEAFGWKPDAGDPTQRLRTQLGL